MGHSSRGVALGGSNGDDFIVIVRYRENGSFPKELLFQQENSQQDWECLEEGRAVGDLCGDPRGEESALGRRVGWCAGYRRRQAEAGSFASGAGGNAGSSGSGGEGGAGALALGT